MTEIVIAAIVIVTEKESVIKTGTAIVTVTVNVKVKE